MLLTPFSLRVFAVFMWLPPPFLARVRPPSGPLHGEPRSPLNAGREGGVHHRVLLVPPLPLRLPLLPLDVAIRFVLRVHVHLRGRRLERFIAVESLTFRQLLERPPWQLPLE